MKYTELDNAESVSEAVNLKALKRPERKAPLSVDRLPPHSLEAEQGVLGCMFLSPQTCIGECVSKFKDGSSVFYDLRHQAIYETLVKMWDGSEAIDVITVMQRLKDGQQLESAGGLEYLAKLPDVVPSAANLGFYLKIAIEKHILRKMISTCTDVVSRVYDYEGEVENLMDEMERDVLAIRKVVRHSDDETPIKELVRQSIDRFEQYFKNQGQPIGLQYGYYDLDKMTLGLHAGEMVGIGGRPSMGKTSLVMNIAENIVLDQRMPVGVLTAEMTKAALVDRMICSRARVNGRDVQNGHFTERDFAKLSASSMKLANSLVEVRDVRGFTILKVRAIARRLKQQHGIKLLVLDYLQLLKSTSKQAQGSREREVSEISTGLKEIAGELDIPLIVAIQIGRGQEKEKNRQPRMSDFRESGSIEQDLDFAGILWNPKAGDSEDDTPISEDGGEIVLQVLKQRNGPVGPVHLTFLKKFTRFESVSRISDDSYQPHTRDD